jgi:hypothetical protein
MSVLTQLLTRNHPQPRLEKRPHLSAKAERTGTGENIWCAATFLFFLILGPFAAVPAVISLFSLKLGEGAPEPEKRR